jgi:hypothetical protein
MGVTEKPRNGEGRIGEWETFLRFTVSPFPQFILIPYEGKFKIK